MLDHGRPQTKLFARQTITMKEYTLLLVDNGDNEARIRLLSLAAVFFGGYTLGPQGQGAWFNTETEEFIYDNVSPLCIATEDEEQFLRFANYVKQDLEQVAVYVRFPDNTVRFI
jgi:hypothetical protein